VEFVKLLDENFKLSVYKRYGEHASVLELAELTGKANNRAP